MKRALHGLVLVLGAEACTLKTVDKCPDDYTVADPDCREHYCREHASDWRCADAGLDASMEASTGEAGALDASVRPDASMDGGCVGCAECRQELECRDKPDARVHCSAGGACVACETNAQCTFPAAPRCAANACVGCTGAADCARFEGAPACGAMGVCVECTASAAERCTSAGKVCKTGSNTCVACNQNSECKDPSASRCTDNACTACMANADCAHVAGKPVCHEGACVACAPATEATDCGETACDPETFTCTSIKRSSLAACRPCRSDSECLAEHKCIPVPFGGVDTGDYCMRQVPAATGCVQPYLAAPLSATSRNGAPSAQYCAHNTSVTTCDAVVALTSVRSCTTATAETDCGRGARCERVNTAPNRCTYACSSDAVCPVDFPCNDESSATPYCGG